VNVLRSAPALLLAPESWLRTVFVLTGAALALALGIADFTILSLVATAGTPAWATALAGVALVGGPLLVGLVPAVRQVEGVAAQSLLGAAFPDGTPGAAAGWPQRRRTLGWFLLHVFTGALVVAAVLGMIALAGSWWTVPAAAATVLGTLLVGRFLTWLGPVLLGPSYAERLQRLEADAARATERNRIAREIHDSVGHALSVVTVQASAARKLIERDPGFAADDGESLLFPAAVRRLATRHGGPGGRGLAEANLTDREAEVLRLVAQGRSNAEIAAELFLGVETVKTHVRNVLAKLGARDRVQAVITAYESGFIH
jgi:DNA-binding CsgD family transcriptional regulator/MFS family permease